MPKSFSQKGFAVVESLLVVVVLLIAGGTGFYVYHASKTASDTLAAASQSSQSSPGKAAKAINARQPSPPASYLDITQWNVKIGLSQASEGASYKVAGNDTSNPPIFLEVFSSQGAAIVSPAGKNCENEYIALLMRLPKDDPRWKDIQFVGASAAQKDIGSYRYNIATKKQYLPECLDKSTSGSEYVADQAAFQKFDAIVKAFVDDFESIKAD